MGLKSGILIGGSPDEEMEKDVARKPTGKAKRQALSSWNWPHRSMVKFNISKEDAKTSGMVAAVKESANTTTIAIAQWPRASDSALWGGLTLQVLLMAFNGIYFVFLAGEGWCGSIWFN